MSAAGHSNFQFLKFCFRGFQIRRTSNIRIDLYRHTPTDGYGLSYIMGVVGRYYNCTVCQTLTQAAFGNSLQFSRPADDFKGFSLLRGLN